MNIIGIGTPCCRIAECLSMYDNYDVHQIDTHDENYTNFIMVKEQESHEAYEKNYKKLKLKIDGPATIILSGAGKITGIALRLLEQLSATPTSVLYVKPRSSDISEIQKTRHRVVNQILQQLARSGVLKEFSIVDNELIEQLVTDSSIINYWNPINRIISDTFHMVNVFKNTEPLLMSNNKIPETSNISTFSLVDFDNSTEKYLYDLQTPRARSYYFALNEDYIKENKDLLTKVRDFISSRQEEKCDCAYSIYQTAYEQNYVYGHHHATLIQEQDKKLFTSEEA